VSSQQKVADVTLHAAAGLSGGSSIIRHEMAVLLMVVPHTVTVAAHADQGTTSRRSIR